MYQIVASHKDKLSYDEQRSNHGTSPYENHAAVQQTTIGFIIDALGGGVTPLNSVKVHGCNGAFTLSIVLITGHQSLACRAVGLA
jgi:hypothetical protein